jgi:hypothetical protein
VKESPILFNTDMVRAILDGRKTQTRRIVKWFGADGLNLNASSLSVSNVAPDKWALMSMGASCWEERAHANCPYGVPGDLLWVREAWAPGYQDGGRGTIFRADGSFYLGARKHERGPYFHAKEVGSWIRWRPSIHMPRWASRIMLEITDVRVQRLHEVTDEDAKAEGVEPLQLSSEDIANIQISDENAQIKELARLLGPGQFSYKAEFRMLWDSIYAKRGHGWDVNDWVWAYTFKRI